MLDGLKSVSRNLESITQELDNNQRVHELKQSLLTHSVIEIRQ